MYKELQTEREASKKLLLERIAKENVTEDEIFSNLDRYMGTVGSSAAKFANQKVASDYLKDFVLEEHIDDGGQVFNHNGNLTMSVAEDHIL